ncbi:hypothetical protein MASR1M74_06590 [Lentimicrobium sp.]
MKNKFTHFILNRKSLFDIILMTGFLICCLSRIASGENIISAGTTLRVSSGTTLVSVENMVIKNSGTLNNSGTVIALKNVVNENTALNSLGNGTLRMAGNSQQSISGDNSIQNLVINNAAGIVNNGLTHVGGSLTLTTGRIVLGNYHLTLGPSASIAGTVSASAMVVATGNGELRKSFSSPGSFTFTVGDNTGVAEYSPVTIAFSSGSFSGSNYVGVKLVNAAYPGSSGSYLNRYWVITQSGISGFSCNAMFQYTLADVTGSEASIFCMRVLPEPPVSFNAANTTLHQLTANNVFDFGTFTGRIPLSDKTLNLTLLLEGLYNGGLTMRKANNASGPQFPGLTADQIQIELHHPANYSNILYTTGNINLSTTGQAIASIPSAFGGSYYITIKHRNSIETVSAIPVSFGGTSITYPFNVPAMVYGSNLKLMYDGAYVIYSGDVNQDGTIDTNDISAIDNDVANFVSGYLPTDVNGDGNIDTSDITITDNNAISFTGAITP